MKKPNPGDHKLTNVITSDTPGGNCPPGSTDPRCGTTTPVSGLLIKKTSDKRTANPGDKVGYTVQVTNTGQTTQDAATFTDDLTQVLDDAKYNGDAAANVGAVSYVAPKVTWTGSLAAGASATVTYSVTVYAPPKGDGRLRNAVSSDIPGGNCPPGSTDPRCSTDTPFIPTPPPVASTGFPGLPLTLLAVALILIGGIAVLVTRRRRTE